MKITNNGQKEQEIQETGPKLRNINEEKEAPPEKPEGADRRLKFGVAAIAVLAVITIIRGAAGNSGLEAKLEEQRAALDLVKAEALVYGITEDEDGDLVLPYIDMSGPKNPSDMSKSSMEERNEERLAEFVKTLLSWKGKSQYDAVRQKLITDFGVPEDGTLLTLFMPPVDEGLDTNMKYDRHTTFMLSNDGKNMSYFILCEVKSVNGSNRADGIVGVRATVNEDGTLADVTAQTLGLR